MSEENKTTPEKPNTDFEQETSFNENNAVAGNNTITEPVPDMDMHDEDPTTTLNNTVAAENQQYLTEYENLYQKDVETMQNFCLRLRETRKRREFSEEDVMRDLKFSTATLSTLEDPSTIVESLQLVFMRSFMLQYAKLLGVEIPADVRHVLDKISHADNGDFTQQKKNKAYNSSSNTLPNLGNSAAGNKTIKIGVVAVVVLLLAFALLYKKDGGIMSMFGSSSSDAKVEQTTEPTPTTEPAKAETKTETSKKKEVTTPKVANNEPLVMEAGKDTWVVVKGVNKETEKSEIVYQGILMSGNKVELGKYRNITITTSYPNNLLLTGQGKDKKPVSDSNKPLKDFEIK